MACFHPLRAWPARAVNPATGRRPMVFRLGDSDPVSWYQPHRLACGQCVGCRIDWAGDWAARCEKEAKLYTRNCFITLTYNDENLPIGGSTRSTVAKRDWQLFMKRLRKAYPTNGIRFFMCAEYGDLNQRAHFHALLFNHDFPDKRVWKPHPRTPLYLSESLQQLWGNGFASLGTVSFQSASYVARYVLKKLTGKQADYQDRDPPFVLMSRNPGIGSGWYDKFKGEIYPAGQLLVGENKPRRTPRYFDEKYRLEDPDGHFKMKLERRLKAESSPHNTLDRLAAREAVLKGRLSNINRKL